ncbi:MAG: type 3 dihydrofolate reductase [Gammaproteobacteria bacterium]|nr:type 3 dihydrofolate reductase [Gammaproteobacteria bacterium]
MIISLIAAMGKNSVIGINNSLPWKLPADMKWFREQTMGKPIVMGRKTFESFGAKPLPGRTNIIITNDTHYAATDCIVVHSIDGAINAADDANEIMVIGGASFYAQTLPRTDRMYLTYIHHEFEGDSWFPQYNPDQWHEIKRIDCAADEKNRYDYTFIILERIRI